MNLEASARARPEARPRSEHDACLICAGRKLEAMPRYERCHLVRCASCGFVFVGRIPTEQELTECYSTKYEENESGYEWLSPVTSKRLFEWLDFMEPFRKRNRILDVGCGAGHLLSHAKERGWDAHGTEYPDSAVERCRKKGIPMEQGPLDPKNYEPESFDVVTSLGVIEHVTDPRGDVENMIKVLRPGGLLYITTPNFDSLSRLVLREKWNVIMYPEHLSYFTPKTMSAMLESVGLRKRKIETTGLSVTRAGRSVSGQDLKYVAPDLADEKIRSALESRAALRRVKDGINRVLTIAGRGDELKAQFVKPG